MEEGYDKVGSLLRYGPKPYLTRMFNEDTYDQAVLKYMANEKCGRMEAQGNMDCFFDNAQDWALAKMIEKKGGYKRDYAKLDQKQAALSVVWGIGVTLVIVSIVNDIASGNYCANSPDANFCRFI
eukprot:CAMPEP_0197835324 /NCGR_PEP_ID=MMETSP1437-20131217/25382_1 /TAXON_ID=49252 ORGANISM="Eucampia antarctica, Strain CCMP1452" /NCGR_SAMPLE_ID=MMETSP1437 /ASSEMBLY_ACC=CAM_ASM_001096 /LENGTH=124 /DNA_ID=CAMNT_0043440663 /DNA_START=269 /DNA_END=643 /DNA_ORIENTATION=-